MSQDKPDNSSKHAAPDPGEGVTAYSEPLLQLSGRGGIDAVTPESAIFSAGYTSLITAGNAINFAVQGGYYNIVKAGISMFTVGKLAAPESPNQETGIALHAASGKVSSQSQSGQTRLTADQNITVASVAADVSVVASKHILLTAGGAGLRLEGGNITIEGPGTMAFKASAVELTGPDHSSPTLPAMPQADQLQNRVELNYHYANLEPVAGAAYKVTFADGTSRTGKLDAKGHAVLESVPTGAYHVEYGEDERTWTPPPVEPDAALQRARRLQDQAKAAIETEHQQGEQRGEQGGEA